ncbi:MAG: zinc ribbon domain-containing protein [Coriobacteriales bacterium]|jgi:RNA polymerase subunit RPABC4/transcription elongation factor Spt4|nr:zinc ribbon domain-containing protein [Coriobacteriales bacterium]
MGDILSQILTPELRIALIIVFLFIAALYVISIIWVVRDAYARGASSRLWGIIALVPFLGAFAYAMLRPPLLLADVDEQKLEFALKQREIMQYGECRKCGYPVERDYILCPNCGTTLRIKCSNCGRAMNPDWEICPWCGTQAGNGPVVPVDTSAAKQVSPVANPAGRASRGKSK